MRIYIDIFLIYTCNNNNSYDNNSNLFVVVVVVVTVAAKFVNGAEPNTIRLIRN